MVFKLDASSYAFLLTNIRFMLVCGLCKKWSRSYFISVAFNYEWHTKIKLPIMSFQSKTHCMGERAKKRKKKKKSEIDNKDMCICICFFFIFLFLFCIFYEIFAFPSHLIFKFEYTYNMIKCTTLIAFSFIYFFIKTNKVVNDMSIQIEIAFLC